MQITVMGLGTVAQSDGLALARTHDVVLTGSVKDRVDAINSGEYPLADPSVSDYVAANDLSIHATLDTDSALKSADLILIATPLAHDARTGKVSTFELEAWVEYAHRKCPKVPIVIRSAVPIGFTRRMREILKSRYILYAPEFMREAHSLQDVLAPKFMIIGDRGELGTKVGAVLMGACTRSGIEMRLMGASEAEAVKHYSQAYLAARVAYFNELDSYALAKNLDARQVIDGVCLDPRIGAYANNPCFGLGGERVPRTMSQLENVNGAAPTHVLPNIALAQKARTALLASKVLEQDPQVIGVYCPGGSTRSFDPLIALQAQLESAGAKVITYTGQQDKDDLGFQAFKDDCDVVLAQRITPELRDLGAKLFSRDLYAAT